MSENDEKSLLVHKRTFKEEKRRHHIIAFTLKTLATDINNWKPVLSALQVFKERAYLVKHPESLASLMLDILRVFALDSMTTCMAYLCN